MTNQEAFDIVVRHLRAQGAKSEIGCTCLYRGPAGMKCAIGALLTDEEARICERKPVVDICFLGLAPSLFGLDVLLLRNLQGIHDAIAVECWEECLSHITTWFPVTLPPK